nr:MAG TPA: hypothetical protein [Caudoviricetes sp.]
MAGSPRVRRKHSGWSKSGVRGVAPSYRSVLFRP